MRVLRHFVPLDDIARAVRAEHGIRRIFHIGGRVVGRCRDDLLRVVTGRVAIRRARQPTAALGVRGDLGPVVAHGGDRRRTGQNRAVTSLLGRLKRAVHALNIGHRASDALVRQFQPEGVIRLKQQTLGSHQAVAYRAVSCFSEVAAFGVLDMRAACNNGDLHIRDRRTGQHAQVRFFRQMRENQALPVQVEHIGRARSRKLDAAAALCRFKQQMHLGVMPQRLKMADADDRLGDGLAVDDAALVERHVHAEAFRDNAGEDFQLHLTHQLQVNLAEPLVPHHAKLWVLLLQLAQIAQHDMRVAPFRQAHAVPENGFQNRRQCTGFRAEAHTRTGMRETSHRTHHAALCALSGAEFFARVNADAADFFLPAAILIAGKLLTHRQRTAGDFQVRQAVALGISCDFEHAGTEVRAVLRCGKIAFQTVQQRVHAVQLQRRAEVARKGFSLRDQLCDLAVVQTAGLKVLLEQALIAHSKLLRHRVRRGEVHTAAVQPRFQLLQECISVCAVQIHLVDEQERRDALPGQQPPQRFRVRLHAVRAADDQHRTVEHLQRALHLRREIDVPGRVEQRHLGVRQRELCLLGEDRDAARTLERKRVKECVLMVHAA